MNLNCIIIDKRALDSHGLDARRVDELGPAHDEDDDLVVLGPLSDTEELIASMERRGLEYLCDFVELNDGGGHFPGHWSFGVRPRESQQIKPVRVGPGVSVVLRKDILQRSSTDDRELTHIGEIVDESEDLIVFGPFFEAESKQSELEARGLQESDDFFCLDYSGGPLPKWCTYVVSLGPANDSST